jgi:Kef-type K+ transport system membrane component KefB
VTAERILFELFVIFAAAKLAGEIFERIKQPPVIGELLAGILLGAGALGVVGDTDVHEAFQELGAIVLLFMVGLDTRLDEIRLVGRRALVVGALGIVVPFAAGAAFIYAIEGSLDESVFVGAAMVATSVGITARVLSDLGVIHAVESRIILGAAVVDDVLGLLVLSAVGGATDGEDSLVGAAVLAAIAVVFVVLVGRFGSRVVQAVAPRIEGAAVPRGPLVAALGLCLGLSWLAGVIGLAAIIGAFLAGMAFSAVRPRWELEAQVEPVYQLLVPFFFVITGARVDPGVLFEPSSLWLVAAVTAIAIAGKLVGCGAAAWGLGRRSVAIIATGMVPRGEVGIIVASVGLARGLIDAQLYGVVVAMSILTTLATPPVLKILFAARAREEREARPGRTDEIEGIGG